MSRVRWHLEKTTTRTRCRQRRAMIHDWPRRGETVLVCKDERPFPMRIADAFVIEADKPAYLLDYVPGHAGMRSGLVRWGEVVALTNCLRCLRIWRSCTCRLP